MVAVAVSPASFAPIIGGGDGDPPANALLYNGQPILYNGAYLLFTP
jgi:hypothetical protein